MALEPSYPTEALDDPGVALRVPVGRAKARVGHHQSPQRCAQCLDVDLEGVVGFEYVFLGACAARGWLRDAMQAQTVPRAQPETASTAFQHAVPADLRSTRVTPAVVDLDAGVMDAGGQPKPSAAMKATEGGVAGNSFDLVREPACSPKPPHELAQPGIIW